MGLGDYLSDRTEHDYAANEQRIAKWECKNDLHAQAVGMVQVYEDAEEQC
jgi:DNA transposition AAA+ family ATPase